MIEAGGGHSILYSTHIWTAWENQPESGIWRQIKY